MQSAYIFVCLKYILIWIKCTSISILAGNLNFLKVLLFIVTAIFKSFHSIEFLITLLQFYFQNEQVYHSWDGGSWNLNILHVHNVTLLVVPNQPATLCVAHIPVSAIYDTLVRKLDHSKQPSLSDGWWLLKHFWLSNCLMSSSVLLPSQKCKVWYTLATVIYS